jgi:hypothetical protein
MRRTILTGILLLAGCQSVNGPRDRRCSPPPVDPPCLTPGEQDRRVRDRFALPDPSPQLAPPIATEPPGMYGR